MPGWRTRVLVAAAAVALTGRIGAAQSARFPSNAVRVEIVLGDAGRASVSERYALTGSPAGISFQYLTDPCAEIGPVFGSMEGRRSAFQRERDGGNPWVTLRPATTTTATDGLWQLDYEAATRGSEAAVPIVMPSAPLDSAAGARGARVDIGVRWSGRSGDARVAMPRLESAGPDVWRATLLAMPSSIRVDVPERGGERCGRDRAGSAGGLEWRAAVFAGTMAVWVPAYLLWFGRRWPRVS